MDVSPPVTPDSSQQECLVPPTPGKWYEEIYDPIERKKSPEIKYISDDIARQIFTNDLIWAETSDSSMTNYPSEHPEKPVHGRKELTTESCRLQIATTRKKRFAENKEHQCSNTTSDEEILSGSRISRNRQAKGNYGFTQQHKRNGWDSPTLQSRSQHKYDERHKPCLANNQRFVYIDGSSSEIDREQYQFSRCSKNAHQNNRQKHKNTFTKYVVRESDTSSDEYESSNYAINKQNLFGMKDKTRKYTNDKAMIKTFNRSRKHSSQKMYVAPKYANHQQSKKLIVHNSSTEQSDVSMVSDELLSKLLHKTKKHDFTHNHNGKKYLVKSLPSTDNDSNTSEDRSKANQREPSLQQNYDLHYPKERNTQLSRKHSRKSTHLTSESFCTADKKRMSHKKKAVPKKSQQKCDFDKVSHNEKSAFKENNRSGLKYSTTKESDSESSTNSNFMHTHQVVCKTAVQKSAKHLHKSKNYDMDNSTVISKRRAADFSKYTKRQTNIEESDDNSAPKSSSDSDNSCIIAKHSYNLYIANSSENAATKQNKKSEVNYKIQQPMSKSRKKISKHSSKSTEVKGEASAMKFKLNSDKIFSAKPNKIGKINNFQNIKKHKSTKSTNSSSDESSASSKKQVSKKTKPTVSEMKPIKKLKKYESTHNYNYLNKVLCTEDSSADVSDINGARKHKNAIHISKATYKASSKCSHESGSSSGHIKGTNDSQKVIHKVKGNSTTRSKKKTKKSLLSLQNITIYPPNSESKQKNEQENQQDPETISDDQLKSIQNTLPVRNKKCPKKSKVFKEHGVKDVQMPALSMPFFSSTFSKNFDSKKLETKFSNGVKNKKKKIQYNSLAPQLSEDLDSDRQMSKHTHTNSHHPITVTFQKPFKSNVLDAYDDHTFSKSCKKQMISRKTSEGTEKDNPVESAFSRVISPVVNKTKSKTHKSKDDQNHTKKHRHKHDSKDKSQTDYRTVDVSQLRAKEEINRMTTIQCDAEILQNESRSYEVRTGFISDQIHPQSKKNILKSPEAGTAAPESEKTLHKINTVCILPKSINKSTKQSNKTQSKINVFRKLPPNSNSTSHSEMEEDTDLESDGAQINQLLLQGTTSNSNLTDKTEKQEQLKDVLFGDIPIDKSEEEKNATEYATEDDEVAQIDSKQLLVANFNSKTKKNAKKGTGALELSWNSSDELKSKNGRRQGRFGKEVNLRKEASATTKRKQSGSPKEDSKPKKKKDKPVESKAPKPTRPSAFQLMRYGIKKAAPRKELISDAVSDKEKWNENINKLKKTLQSRT